VKKIISLIVVLLVFASFGISATTSYTYSTYSGSTTTVPCPDPFLPEKVYTMRNTGVSLKAPKDICFDKIGNIYVLDSEAEKIYIFDADMKHTTTVDGFIKDGEKQSFAKPQGMFVTSDGQIYICDTQNKRVVWLNSDFTFNKEYLCPKSDVLESDYRFLPKKITVDNANNLYIINSDEYQGIMQIDEAGNFIAFVGSDKVKYDPITLMWKKIMSEKQAEQLTQFIPVEYFNLSIDNEGFIYAVSAATGEEPIKRLNTSGSDILNRYGYVKICGDINVSNDASFQASLFTDIDSNENGNYFAIDSVRCKIFTYNRDGYLLYVYDASDVITAPAALAVNNDKLYVTDLYDGSIVSFSFSKFGKTAIDADNMYSKGMFEESFENWENVLKMNANYELAYAQLGRIYLRNGEYEKAMDNFLKGNIKGSSVTKLDGYNKAFSEWRKQWAMDNLGKAFVIILVLVLAYYIVKIILKRRRKNK